MKLIFALILLGISLCGCDAIHAARTGVSSRINTADIERSGDDQSALVKALKGDSLNAGSTGDLYSATQFGFNYVDDQCRVYFNDLFAAEKDLQATRSTLSAAGQTTSAILGITGASKITLAIVAQAFGLGTNLTDVAASSFLFHLPAAPTKDFVRRMQIAYRQGVAERRSNLTAPDVYYHIQSYLDLCLPSTIEGNITKYLGSAEAFSLQSGSSSGSAFDLRLASEISKDQLRGGKDKVPAPRIPIYPKSDSILNDIEAKMKEPEIEAIQKALCLTVTKSLGPKGSTTRVAIRGYLEKIDATHLSQKEPEEITVWGRAQLHELVDSKPACTQKG
ncbi:hypothetical protein ACVITL_005752 [Rhizobium pisi]